MHHIVYAIIINDKASYVDIRDNMDIYEVLDLYELVVVSAYNRKIAMEGDK